MNQRTKHFQLRLTTDEAIRLKEKAASHPSVSFYRKFQNELSWAGGNLNQSVKRANELSVAGLLSQAYLQEVLLPVIMDTRETLNEIKRELYAVTKKATRL